MTYDPTEMKLNWKYMYVQLLLTLVGDPAVSDRRKYPLV